MKKRFRESYQRIIRVAIKTVFSGIVVLIMFFNISALFVSNETILEGGGIGIDKAYALDTGVAIPGHSGNTFADFNAYIKAVFDFSLKLGVALTALMLIFAGYKYMTSQGNPSALNEAKDIMIGSLSGFIMLLLVYLILNVYNLTPPA